MTDRLLVSIGVPTCNRAPLLERALRSLVAQDYPNLEIVVSDNASTDETPDVCARFQRRYPSIRYHRVQVRTPAFENFRTALLLSRGRYFMWASDDDSWDPAFVSVLVDRLESVHNLMLVAAEAQYVLHDGTGLPYFPEGEAFYDPPSPSRLRRILVIANHGYGNLIYGLYRREALVDPNGGTVLDVCRFSNELPVFIRVADRGGIQVCDKILFYKTVPMRIYLQAAREYRITPEQALVEAGGRRGDGETAPPARPGLADVPSRSYRDLVKVFQYHMRTLADIRRAVWRIDSGFGLKLMLFLVFTVRLIGHFLKLAVVWPVEEILRKRPTPSCS